VTPLVHRVPERATVPAASGNKASDAAKEPKD